MKVRRERIKLKDEVCHPIHPRVVTGIRRLLPNQLLFIRRDLRDNQLITPLSIDLRIRFATLGSKRIAFLSLLVLIRGRVNH